MAPGSGDLWHDLACDISSNQVVEDVAIDRVALGVPLQMRVHRSDVAGQIHGQRILGLCQSFRRDEGNEEHEGDATHCWSPLIYRQEVRGSTPLNYINDISIL